MCALICVGTLAGCGGSGSMPADSVDSNAVGAASNAAAHEETVIHADPPVKAMFESKYSLTGKTHEEWISQIINPAFTERRVCNSYGSLIEEPVMLSVVPISWDGGRILDLERVHEEKNAANSFPYGVNNSIDFKDANGKTLSYINDGYKEKAEALRKTHPEYQGVFWCELRYTASDNDDY